MLRKFRVSNFKSFNKDFELDLTDINGYEFNKNCIKNNTVNNAIIYGHNGVGKSNLALAIFDIIEHLTDKNRNEKMYENYLNAYNNSESAEFYFEFFINNKTVNYEYKKSDYKTIKYERFKIDDEEFICYDRALQQGAIVNLKGAETLKKDIDNHQLSILKYIRNNSELEPNETNRTFTMFFDFIDKMLYFKTLADRAYLGQEMGSKNILEDIINNDNVIDFETFLNKAGIECKLTEIELLNKKTIAFNFAGKLIPYEQVISTGTFSLTFFYYWYQSIKNDYKVSFLFIDEFDAFYHHSLSEMILNLLKDSGVQFILTTHNTSIISNELLRPDCYFLMTKEKIKSLSKCTTKELREAHNIEKMYKSNAFHVE